MTTAFPKPLVGAEVAALRHRLLESVDQAVERGPFDDAWASLQEVGVADWYRDAKFGIFIHWLGSAVPAFGNEWYARHMYIDGTPEFAHHRETFGDQKDFGYKDFLPEFRGEHFDAGDWLGLVQRAGARFVVPVAEHHDGFSLSDSGLSRWTATRLGPGRDVIGELRAAAEERGIHFGLSSHRAENWWFYNGGTRFDSDVADPEWADLYGPAKPKDTQPDREFLDDWLARTAELVENYSPELVYFDWWIEEPAFEPYLRRFAAFYYNRARATGHDVVVNYKWNAFAPGSAVYDIERGAARGIEPTVFQNDTSSSRATWCYLENDDYKSVEEILVDLVDAVSKNGNLLLNIGPKPDGTIDPRERLLLEGIGDWLAVNGEAIYGTRPWLVYGEGPTQPAGGSFVDATPQQWTSSDLRFTCREDSLYVVALRAPRDGRMVIRSLGSDLRLLNQEIHEVLMLGSAEALTWHRTAEALVVDVPHDGPSIPALRVVLRSETRPPRFEPPIPQ